MWALLVERAVYTSTGCTLRGPDGARPA